MTSLIDTSQPVLGKFATSNRDNFAQAAAEITILQNSVNALQTTPPSYAKSILNGGCFIGIAPSGNVTSTTGAITFAPSSRMNYSMPNIYWYFVTGALYAASPAGFYYCTQVAPDANPPTNTTVVTANAYRYIVYNNVYTPGTTLPKVPTSLVPFTTCVVGAFVGYASTTPISMIQQTISANALGLNGRLTANTNWSYANTSGIKSFTSTFGTSQRVNKQYSTYGSNNQLEMNWINKGVATAQGLSGTFNGFRGISAEYATWDPINYQSTQTGGYSGVNFDATNLIVSPFVGINSFIGTQSITAGSWYWEVTLNTAGGNISVGIAQQFSNVIAVYQTGNIFVNGTSTITCAGFTSGDKIGLAFNATAGTLTFYKNNVSLGTISNIAAGEWNPYLMSSYFNSTITANFGASAFAYTVPTGYSAGIFTQIPFASSTVNTTASAPCVIGASKSVATDFVCLDNYNLSTLYSS
jgi:hypothetical protein